MSCLKFVAVVERVELVEEGRRDSIVSLGSDRLSIGNLAPFSDQTTLGGNKKRTLFSQAQNTLLDISMHGSPATTARNTRFLRTSELFVFSPPVASTQQPNDASANVVPSSSRGGAGRLSESSDSEVEFKRPNKISRTDLGALVSCFLFCHEIWFSFDVTGNGHERFHI